MKLKKFLMLCTFGFVVMCKSTDPIISQGIQPKYHALNPSRILAVPVFLVPNPKEPSLVDKGDLEVSKAIPKLEEIILNAFANQPAVNGISFAAVRREIGKSPNIWDALNSFVQSTAKRVATPLKIDPKPLPENCFDSKNFIDFYGLCVSQETEWKNDLNTLSAKVFNADAALLFFITHANKKLVDEQYQTEVNATAIMVDTNNGKIIWSRTNSTIEKDTEKKGTFPTWQKAFENLLDENFWQGFPGRAPKSEINEK